MIGTVSLSANKNQLLNAIVVVYLDTLKNTAKENWREIPVRSVSSAVKVTALTENTAAVEHSNA